MASLVRVKAVSAIVGDAQRIDAEKIEHEVNRAITTIERDGGAVRTVQFMPPQHHATGLAMTAFIVYEGRPGGGGEGRD